MIALEVGVAPEVVAESILRMLRFECGCISPGIKFDNQFLHSLARANNNSCSW